MSVAQSARIGSDIFADKEKINIRDMLIEKTPNELLQESIKKLESFAQIQTAKGQPIKFKKTNKKRTRKFGKSVNERKRLHRWQKNPPRP